MTIRQLGFQLILFFSFLSIGCLKPIDLFEYVPPIDETPHIDNLYSLDIFTDYMSKEVWFSGEQVGCINVEQEESITFSGDGSLHITWDKISSPCEWIGMGIGWDNWAGKNLSSVYDKSAIQFKIRTAKDVLKSLPVAFALEDYGNVQAWVGFNRNMLSDKVITEEWSTVTIPISEFDWEKDEADIGNIKQFMIQFEAAGDVFVDEIKIVEHKGSLRKRATAYYYEEGVFNFANSSFAPTIEMDNNKFYVSLDKDFLYFYATVEDETPMENVQDGDNIWNGDAIEIAFSTNSEALPKRKRYLFSDQQIGIKVCDEPIVWNWRKHKIIESAEVITEKTPTGYSVNLKIPLSEFELEEFELNKVYGLEIALDSGDKDGRKTQSRWNNPDQEGFHTNPSLWGEMVIVPYKK